jgi:Ran GTPase-activating protein (RanGAP) involved in mRNA processing and transport
MALKTNKTLQVLDMDDCNLKDDCLEWLGDALGVNTSLRVLKLRENNFILGFKLLATGLKCNTTLQALKIDGSVYTNIVYSQLDDFMKVIQTHPSLTVLHIGTLHTDPTPFSDAIVDLLNMNTTLTSLNLGRNRFVDYHISRFANSLKINKTLQSLDLNSNQINTLGMVSLFDVLTHTNRTLTSLCLSSNNNFIIPTKALEMVPAMLYTNKILQKVDLRRMHRTTVGNDITTFHVYVKVFDLLKVSHRILLDIDQVIR